MPQFLAYLPILRVTPLFAGFTDPELLAFMQTFTPAERTYQKGEHILLAGYENHEIGVILSGEAEAVKETKAGGIFVVARQKPGGVLGDVLSGGQVKSPVSVRAVKTCSILFFSYPALLAAPEAHSRLLRHFFANLVAVLSTKYFALDRRIGLLLYKSLRQKLAATLLDEAAARGHTTFDLPYTRAALAHYLGCERSALSREISRMAAEGFFTTDRRRFTLLRTGDLQALL